jgi:hypothetical protein
MVTGWLLALYQGPRFTLWGYNVRTGAVRSTSAPCCLDTVMTVVRPPRSVASLHR